MGAIDIDGCWPTTVPVEGIWAVVTDLSTWGEWWPAISHVETLPAPSGTVAAARLTFSTRPPLRPFTSTVEVTDREEPHRFEVTLADGPLRGEGTFTIHEDDAGSTACYDVSLAVRSLLFRPLEPILRSATRSSGQARLERAGADLAALAGGTLR